MTILLIDEVDEHIPAFDEVASDDAPNAETRQAIYEAEQGINLVVCEHADDLFKKLGI